MGKHVVDTATMDIDRLAEKAHGHGGTFNMPTWAAGAKRTLPKEAAIALWVIGFPQCKISHLLFAIFICFIVPRGVDLEILQTKMGKPSIGRKATDRIIDAAARAAIGISLGQ